jgi:hypothetical protein
MFLIRNVRVSCFSDDGDESSDRFSLSSDRFNVLARTESEVLHSQCHILECKVTNVKPVSQYPFKA